VSKYIFSNNIAIKLMRGIFILHTHTHTHRKE